MMLTCATIAAAVLAAAPGDVLTLAPGSECNAVTVRNRQWAAPVTLVARGASIKHLTLWDVAGLHVVGGTYLPVDPLASDLRGRGITIRGAKSGRLVVREASFIGGGKALVVSDARGVLVEGNLFEPRQDGIAIASAHEVTVRGNLFRGFHPLPTRCTVGGEVLLGLSSRDCVAKGGAWKDGDHADAVQVFGRLSTDILIEGNASYGHAHCYGMMKSRADRGERVRIVGNVCETSARHGGLIEDCTDCEMTGNRFGRWGDTPNKVQVRAINSTGIFCGNVNPDARLTDMTARPCPDAPKGAVGSNSEFAR